MSALVERIISLRDDIRVGRGTVTRVELDTLADAANSVTELLGALKELRGFYEGVCSNLPMGMMGSGDIAHDLARTDAAIAKAEGRS